MDEVETIMHPLVMEFSKKHLADIKAAEESASGPASIFSLFSVARIISAVHVTNLFFIAKTNFSVSNFCDMQMY